MRPAKVTKAPIFQRPDDTASSPMMPPCDTPTKATLSSSFSKLALASAFSWAAFCLFRLYEGDKAGNILKQAFAVSAATALVLHLSLETFALPSLSSLSLAVLIGVIPLGLATLVWDNGMRLGDRRLLTIMAYATPLVSTAILIACGFATPSLAIVMGGGLIVAAGLISAKHG